MEGTIKAPPPGRRNGKNLTATAPSGVAPAGGVKKKSKPKPKRKKGLRRRPARRPDEDRPGPDYLQRMRRLGPRERESYISFEMRMAAMLRGRQLLLDVASECSGHEAPMKTLCDRVGVQPSNLQAHLKTTGLRYADLWQILGTG